LSYTELSNDQAKGIIPKGVLNNWTWYQSKSCCTGVGGSEKIRH